MMRFLLFVCAITLISMPVHAQKNTAAALVTEADAKEFADIKLDRHTGNSGGTTFVEFKATKGDVFSHHMTVYLQTMPPDIPAYPNFVTDAVTQGVDAVMPSDKPKKLTCTVPGSSASACLEINSPMGTFKEGQRMVSVRFGKGRNYVRIELFRDFRADLDFALKLAAKIMTRLP
jgi:hypothetical protein